jgi:hypothetical protein
MAATLFCVLSLPINATELANLPALKQSDLPRLRKLIDPRPEELQWMQIPWSTDLWKARELASRSNKPILLWEMDGHPLGCT